MLEPKKRKYRKSFRGRMKGKAYRGSKISFGELGLKALGCAWLSSRQIEAGRRALTHSIKRGGKVWIRVFPDKPVSSRPAGQRMGGGKGDTEKYVAVITPGKIIYEVAGIENKVMKNALERAGDKMPFKTKIVSRKD
ncbi:50S ribosomal protein L16 [Candidatus Woesebacteria bacterium RIFCSPHIGHO2_01_FULL_38_10]|uniref:Large ribosomal subunit protein uL16 n=2 Tax=Candidatus Woeseibacteriota TaxID=1752722 RepID=A0A1F8B4H0_9BACT|nr:MAG: 50S ribosomal protein L16 [Candidatus Woesebacteria bacterium RIFCSPHIGHO2_01_FULL_38_10]OGM58926.1 MAG: 50S ribosomal protein L16 [Candidatus Woesebacteria bacterium RIFCSPLOWO2_01_FULL_39_10b]